jgi:hypothetical protein
VAVRQAVASSRTATVRESVLFYHLVLRWYYDD